MAYSFGAPKIVTNGLVLYLDAANRRSYPGSGTAWNDLSGNGNGGTLTNGPTFSGDNAGGISFDGVDDYALSNSGAVNLTNTSFSIEVWFKPTLMNADRCIFGHHDIFSSKKSIHYRIYSTGQLRFDFYANSLNVANVISVNNWYQTVATYNYDTDVCKMYLNGQLISSGSVGPFIGNSSTSITYIGAWTDSQQRFVGEIPLAKIYNRALSAEEVLQNYNATKARYNL